MHVTDGCQTYESIDQAHTNSIGFETSIEQLLSMGAPDSFIEMVKMLVPFSHNELYAISQYSTMMEMHMEETGSSIEHGISVEQWLEVLESVAYNPGAKTAVS